jgi:anti-sigma regulatory factor (Ser/Thr protein kinase)/PAS domain-containing protein
MIDLSELPAYIKIGFENCDINEDTLKNSTDWKEIKPNKKNRPIQIPALNLPNLPKRQLIEFRSLPKKDFTLIFFIQLSEEEYNDFKTSGIYFERIGESWEIFWNNQVLDKKVSYEKSLTQKGYIVEIPQSIVQVGKNVLCIHLIGDPISTRTGFYYGREYYIDQLQKIFYNKFLDYFFIIFLITLYTSFGLFNMIFYINQKENKYNLYFSLFCFLISFYIFIRSPLTHYFPVIENTDVSSPLEFISLFLLIPLFSLFFYDIFKEKIPKRLRPFFRVVEIVGIIFSLMILFAPSPNTYGGILKFWQYSTFIFMTLLILLIYYFSTLEFKEFYKKNSFFSSIYKTLFLTVPGNFLVGAIFLGIFVGWDIYINLKKISAPSISNYGFLFFFSGISFRISYNLTKLLNQLKISESKYKYLYNNSSDILFILDDALCIKDINQNFEKTLNWKKDDFVGLNIERLIYNPEKERNPILKNFYQYLKEELEKNSLIRIVLPIVFNSDIPFKYFNVEIRTLEDLEEREYLMKASLMQSNPSMHYLTKEYQKYEIPTDFIHIERILPRITESLRELMEEQELSIIRIGLREILINAMEHGNLGITNQEKTQYLLEGIYDKIIKERLKDPYYQNKKVVIEYKLTNHILFYRITDEGSGFEVEKFLNKEVEFNSFHGRGIFITKNAFDKVIYNKKGNSVTLIKYIKK